MESDTVLYIPRDRSPCGRLPPNSYCRTNGQLKMPETRSIEHTSFVEEEKFLGEF